MKRRLLNLLMALSLLLCVAAAALWVNSFAHPFTLRCSWLDRAKYTVHLYRVSTVDGQLCLTRVLLPMDDPASFERIATAWKIPDRPRLRVEPWDAARWRTNRWGFGGYLYQSLGQAGEGARSKWAVPWWLAVSSLSLLPARHALSRRRRVRRPGQCTTCGYDLRATPGRCPECGTPATAPASSAASSMS